MSGGFKTALIFSIVLIGAGLLTIAIGYPVQLKAIDNRVETTCYVNTTIVNQLPEQTICRQQCGEGYCWVDCFYYIVPVWWRDLSGTVQHSIHQTKKYTDTLKLRNYVLSLNNSPCFYDPKDSGDLLIGTDIPNPVVPAAVGGGIAFLGVIVLALSLVFEFCG